MTREESSRQITDILEYFDDRIEKETDPAFDKEIAKKDAYALRMAIKALEQEPCDDCISRQTVKEQMIKYGFHAPDMTVTEFVEDLPPVNPQTRTGYWIYKKYGGYEEQGNYHCSSCGNVDNRTPLYCPYCGTKMIEEELWN